MANNNREHQYIDSLAHASHGGGVAGTSQAEIDALLAEGDGQSLDAATVDRIFRKAGLSSHAADGTQADAELGPKLVELVTQADGAIYFGEVLEGSSERLFAGDGDAALAADVVDRVFEKAAAICLLEDWREGSPGKTIQGVPAGSLVQRPPGEMGVLRRLKPLVTGFGRVAAALLVSTLVILWASGRLWPDLTTGHGPTESITFESKQLIEDDEAYRKLRVEYTQRGLPTANADAVARAIADMRESLEKREERLRGLLSEAAKFGPHPSALGLSELASERVAFQKARDTANKFLASAAGHTAPRAPGGKALLLVDSDMQGKIHEAVEGTRPELKGWPADERGGVVKYEDIERLKSMRSIPGGVAFGKVAEVDGDWKDAGLLYDVRDRRAYLVRRKGERIKLPKVDPAVLKTCFAYARSSDPVAISIGWTGEQVDYRIDGVTAPVLIHPALRDTQVGRDIIDVDRLPWRLRDDRLPNGKPNPFVGTLRTLIDREIDSQGNASAKAFLDELRGVADLDAPSSPEQRLRLLDTAKKLLPRADRRHLIFLAVFESDEAAEARHLTYIRLDRETMLREARAILMRRVADGELGRDASEGDKRQAERSIESLGLDEILGPEGVEKLSEWHQRVQLLFNSLPRSRERALRELSVEIISGGRDSIEGFLRPIALILAATQPDSGLTLRQTALGLVREVGVTHLSLLTDDHVRLVIRGDGMEFDTGLKVRYVHNRIDAAGRDQSQGDGVVEATALGKVVTSLIPELEASYPALRAAREYASWTALLRWAMNKDNLAWVDLADLATINDHIVPTPDYILRGSELEVEAAARRFGLDLKTLPNGEKTTVPSER